MIRNFSIILLTALLLAPAIKGQDSTPVIFKDPATTDSLNVENDTLPTPEISYLGMPKQYKIAGIKVTGGENYEDFVLIGFSGLSVGQTISVPGDQITTAVRRFWDGGLFSDVKILASKIEGDKIWLEIKLTPRSRISQINYYGVKKSERDDLEDIIGLQKGAQFTPNLQDKAITMIKRHFDSKGFPSAEVKVTADNDLSKPNMVIISIEVNKKSKMKIKTIHFVGNDSVSSNTLRHAMKKTNEKFNLKKNFIPSWLELFSAKKFVEDEYINDKKNIITKYNEQGYRDARIVSDSIAQLNDKEMDIYLNIDEGARYHIRNIQFVGNTHYNTEFLETLLDFRKGDVYNQTKLNERLTADDDAVSSIYYNNGYLFFNATPIEMELENDSVSLEIRIVEGPQATINRVEINGNDRLYEEIVRRELRTKPGELFSKDALQRSAREIAQTGHFDAENLDIKPIPDPENGTVDIQYNLVSKANDQVEFSLGWGQTGVIGRISLKFTNFSVNNLFNPSMYRGIIPQGDGQTLSISGQTNGQYYQSYSISFVDPWFGKKRPNNFSIGAYFSYQTDINSSYYGNSYYNPYMYGYGGGYGGAYGGYGGYGGGMYDYTAMYDLNKSISLLGINIGYGKRLNWPDDYFQIMYSLAYQRYKMNDWRYFVIQNGVCNNINFGITLLRNSIDQPLYTRRGSSFELSVAATPPYSLWNGVDYSAIPDNDASKFKFIEYHKWKFKAKIFTPLASTSFKHTPVLFSRIEYGFVGSYNSNKRSPFETFYVGGDGMMGYSSTYATETIGLRGYQNGSLTPYGHEGYAYSRLALELRFPVILEPSSTIYVLGFLEAGNAWQDVADFNPFDLKRSAGVGARIYLPMIGMLGIDWAYGFDPVFGSREYSGSQFHFVLGQEF